MRDSPRRITVIPEVIQVVFYVLHRHLFKNWVVATKPAYNFFSAAHIDAVAFSVDCVLGIAH